MVFRCTCGHRALAQFQRCDTNHKLMQLSPQAAMARTIDYPGKSIIVKLIESVPKLNAKPWECHDGGWYIVYPEMLLQEC